MDELALRECVSNTFWFAHDQTDDRHSAAERTSRFSEHLSNSGYSRQTSRVYSRLGEIMDHNESVRKFEHLMLKQADHAREAAIELEALVPQLPSEKSRELAQLQVKASHKQAKEFRELAQKVHES